MEADKEGIKRGDRQKNEMKGYEDGKEEGRSDDQYHKTKEGCQERKIKKITNKGKKNIRMNMCV